MKRFRGSVGPSLVVYVLAAAVSGCQENSAVGSLGTPGLDTSPAAIASMEGAIVAALATCKDKDSRHVRSHYAPQIKITLDRDGVFAAPPVLVNPSNRYADEKVSAAALAAVNRCNPLNVVRSYGPYYQYWHEYVLDFTPR